LSFAQRAIARGVEAWCSAEGIVVARTETTTFGSTVSAATALIWLDLGDTLVGIGAECVTVQLPYRTANIPIDADRSPADVVAEVTRLLETG
jgi:hypothetical protein